MLTFPEIRPDHLIEDILVAPGILIQKKGQPRCLSIGFLDLADTAVDFVCP
jgi:hypothetical protein